jgi:ribonuclease P protein component
LVFKQGISSASKYLVIYIKPNELGFNRFGLSVGKKIGKAVTRNRIKRLLKEAMRKNAQISPLSSDFVIIPKRSALTCKTDDLVKDIERLILKTTGNNKSL